MNIKELWISEEELYWRSAKNEYWNLIKPSNLDLELKIEKLDSNKIKEMSLEEFYEFLLSDYFKWKYTDSRWLNKNREHFSKYVIEEKLDELEEIQNDLFSFDLNNVERGLKIAMKIKGLGVAGASGLLSVLFPDYFGTVDQFVVKALLNIDYLPEIHSIIKMNEKINNNRSLNINDGVILINIMKNKATELNNKFNSVEWNPRSIDKILWTTRNGKVDLYNGSRNIKVSNYINKRANRINLESLVVNNEISSSNKRILKSLYIDYLI